MDEYFDFYLELDVLTKKFGRISECLLYRHLNTNEIPYVKEKIDYSVLLSKCNVIAISGDSSSGKSTLAELLKNCFFNNSFVLEGDRYHKWERDSDKWSHFTHLDPKANYLSKLEEDVFNLKIGKSIFQVDYDHKLGKFTSPEIINPNENLIVCGLHPLLSKKSNIYDLKIYIEADHKLKTNWKIKRDVTERGKKYAQVLDQINSRKEDYKKYIKPQKENADIIISFLTGAELEKLDSLRLSISKKYKIEKYISDLMIYKIDFIQTEGDKYNEIYFEKYTPCNIFKNKFNKLNGSYYEYILLAIKNIYD
jgi:uridine kinase